jgi:hypothetical protein
MRLLWAILVICIITAQFEQPKATVEPTTLDPIKPKGNYVYTDPDTQPVQTIEQL